MSNENPVELAEVIKALRQELITAQQEGASEDIRFNVNNVEIELETVISKKEVAGAGLKTRFFVVDVDAKANTEFAEASKQRIKLTLGAVKVEQTADGEETSNTLQINERA